MGKCFFFGYGEGRETGEDVCVMCMYKREKERENDTKAKGGEMGKE